jgi:hypothetical protein
MAMIENELVLADLESVEKRLKTKKKAKDEAEGAGAPLSLVIATSPWSELPVCVCVY